MSDAAPLASGGVASRFVSEDQLKAAQEQRQKDWAAAYERIGQEPPKQEESNEPYDGRSLWEKLQENKNKKQETFDEAMKFKNQFRALDQDEISFLDSITEDNTEEEERKQKAIQEELNGFRKAVLSRQAAPPPASLPGAPAPPSSAASPDQSPPPAPAAAAKKPAKKQKKTLPGLIVKKKDDKKTTSAPVAAGLKRSVTEEKQATPSEDPGAKKRKVEADEQ